MNEVLQNGLKAIKRRNGIVNLPKTNIDTATQNQVVNLGQVYGPEYVRMWYRINSSNCLRCTAHVIC